LYPNGALVGLTDGNAKLDSHCEGVIAVELSLLPHERLGIGLQGIDRSDYYLACKTKMRDEVGLEKNWNGRSNASRRTIFRREEEQVARVMPHREVIYPDSPHECCPGGGYVGSIVSSRVAPPVMQHYWESW
jgi:hypothetical protein